MFEFLNFLAELTIANKEFLTTIINLIFMGLRDFQSKRYRQFFLLFEKLIRVKDGYQ